MTSSGGLGQALRSIVGIALGLVLISTFVEALEFGLVTILNGSVTTDPDRYFSIRNRGAVLVAKLAYNTIAALGGGYLVAWIARRAHIAHGIVLALVQLLALLYGAIGSQYSASTPRWVWIALCVTTPPAIVLGALLRKGVATRSRSTGQANVRPGTA